MLNKSRQGITIIEVLIAIVILGLIGTAVITLMLKVASANNSARLRNQAAIYAEQDLEQARGFVQTQGFSCLNSLASGTVCSVPSICSYYQDGSFSSCTFSNPCPTGGNGSPIGVVNFCQYVQLAVAGSGVKVSAVVSWNDKGTNYTTEADTVFYSY